MQNVAYDLLERNSGVEKVVVKVSTVREESGNMRKKENKYIEKNYIMTRNGRDERTKCREDNSKV